MKNQSLIIPLLVLCLLYLHNSKYLVSVKGKYLLHLLLNLNLLNMPMDDHIVRDKRFIVVRRTGWDIDCFHVQNPFFLCFLFTLLSVLLL